MGRIYVDQNLIADQCKFRTKYLQNGEKTDQKSTELYHFSFFNIMSYFHLY